MITSSAPERIERSSTFRVHAPLEEAFPLFGPIREKEWAAGWNPQVIFPRDVEVCERMVFQTRGGLHGSEETYTWVMTKFDRNQHHVEYLVSATERLWLINVQCESSGSSTDVTVSYSYTGLSEEGNRKNRLALEDMFRLNLADWAKAINHYLSTGTLLN